MTGTSGVARWRWQVSTIASYIGGYLAVAVGASVVPAVASTPSSCVVWGGVAVLFAIIGLGWGAYSRARYHALAPQDVGAAGLRATAAHSDWTLYEELPDGEAGWKCGPVASASELEVRPVGWSSPDDWIGFTAGRGWVPPSWDQGAALAWNALEQPAPAMAFLPAGIDAKALGVTGTELDMAGYHLMIPWRVFADDPVAGAAAISPELIKALNTLTPFTAAYFVESSRAIAVADAREVKGGFADLSYGLFEIVSALGPRRLMGDLLDERTPAELDEAYRRAAVGGIRAASRTYARMGLVCLVSVVAGFSAMAGAALMYRSRSRDTDGSELVVPTMAYGAILLGAIAAFAVAWALLRRAMRSQERLALDVMDVARARGWSMVARSPELEVGWTRSPFSRVQRMRWAPVAHGASGGCTAGVAYVEGDTGIGAWAPRLFASRVAWADVGVELPRMDFLREGFSARVAKLCGGTDLDVESYAFNALWRIRAEDPRAAHALLQPGMIALLTRIADEGVAYHLDGTRVALWDDGRNSSVDLARRVELVEEFVAALPGFLRATKA